MTKELIDKAFRFYKIDKKYKDIAYKTLDAVLNDSVLHAKFMKLYNVLYEDNNTEYFDYWNRSLDINQVFGDKAPSFITNLMVIMGVDVHIKKLKENRFSIRQKNITKRKVMECFVNDLNTRNYDGIRISQMLWATYFINCRVITLENLEFCYDRNINAHDITIHIPRQLKKLDMSKVSKSISKASKYIEKYFKLKDYTCKCYSWLLSLQLTPLLKDGSNIKQFQKLFDITEGSDCIKDLLSFVFEKSYCDDYQTLPEKTSLQKSIKRELIKGTVFKKGIGILREK